MLADRLAALEVADVVALDARPAGRQAERVGELLERGQRLALVGQPARLLARERLGRVPRGELHELPLLAALGDRRWTGPPRRSARNASRSPTSGGQRRDVAPRAGWTSPARSTARGSWRGPRRRRPRAPRRAGRRRARPSCRRGSRTAGRRPGCPGAPGRRGRARSGRTPAIFWLSIVRSMARTLSRRTAARSYSRRFAAEPISRLEGLRPGSPGDPRGRAPPGRCRRGRRPSRSPGCTGPGTLDVVQQARPLERPLAVLDVDRAGPEREEPADQVHRLVDARRRRRTARSSGCRRSGASGSARRAGSRRPA